MVCAGRGVCGVGACVVCAGRDMCGVCAGRDICSVCKFVCVWCVQVGACVVCAGRDICSVCKFVCVWCVQVGACVVCAGRDICGVCMCVCKCVSVRGIRLQINTPGKNSTPTPYREDREEPGYPFINNTQHHPPTLRYLADAYSASLSAKDFVVDLDVLLVVVHACSVFDC